MSIGLFVLLSKSLTYIKTNNRSPLEHSRTPYRIILIIPDLAAVARNHRNLRAPYYGCIYCSIQGLIYGPLTTSYAPQTRQKRMQIMIV
jgi:hypothetical protein